ncbi:MAG: helix-turn-helix domain-containing protein [Prevotellaceae bacterium]|nr:helix-turn-helix domain-containing protein [Prevotellaceae bacterium]
MKKAYKYRLKPNKQQKEFLEKSFGCTRYVYNWALGKRRKHTKRTRRV